MDMNADPFEHVKLVVIFAELLCGNFLDFVGRPATSPHDECACIDSPLLPSNHHGHYTVYDTYLEQFLRGEIQIYHDHEHRRCSGNRRDIVLLSRALSGSSPLGTRLHLFEQIF